LHHDNAPSHFFFHQAIFYQIQHGCCPPCTQLTVHKCEAGLLRGWWWSVGPKLIFWPHGSTSPGNYGWLFVWWLGCGLDNWEIGVDFQHDRNVCLCHCPHWLLVHSASYTVGTRCAFH
jgi:hypothetical protein